MTTIDSKTLISWHLSVDATVLLNKEILYSTLTAPLLEVRKLACRNEKTGKYLGNAESPSWLAAMGYFSLIEQLGNAYDVKGHDAKGEPFKRSLKLFSAVTSDERDALWGLRCSLFHDFALVRNERAPKYIFHVGPGGDLASIVHKAATSWDGVMPNDNQTLGQHITTVELGGVGELFESAVFPKAKALAASNRLLIRKLSLKEFQLKYFWLIKPKS